MNLKSKLWISIIIVIVISIYSGFLYNRGYDNGYNKCNKLFSDYKIDQQLMFDKLEEQYREQEKKYFKETENLVVQVAETKETYTQQLIDLERVYSGRLRESEKRASLYKQMSANSKCSTVNLADYTARLDRTVVEGRKLVKELTELVKLRDSQLRQCGEQIKLLQENNYASN